MAAPTFVKATAGATDAGGAWTYTVAAPAAAGNLIIVHVLKDAAPGGSIDIDSATNCTALDGTANEFTPLQVGASVGNPAVGQHWLWCARSTGTSAIVLTGSNSTADDLYYRAYEFTSVISTATSVIQLRESGTVENNTGTSVPDAAVTTTGTDRLALNFVALVDDLAIDAFAGETGGDWTEAVAEYADSAGTDACLQLQIAAMPSAGTINGGTDAITSIGWGVIGLALIPAVDGTPHTASPADSLSLADVTVKAQGLGRSESLALADLFARTTVTARSPADSLVLADATTRAKTIPLAIADTLSLADNAAVAKTKAVAVGDSVALGDARAAARGLGRADSVVLADATARAKTIPKGLTDSLSLADATARVKAIPKSVTDSVTLADSASPALGVGGVGHTRQVDDTLALTDALSRVVTYARAQADGLVLADARATARSKVLTDAVAIADTFARTAAYLRTVADTVALTDSAVPAEAGAGAQPINDLLALSDSFQRVATYARTVADTVALADARAFAQGQALADTVALADARALVRSRSLTDAVALSDLATPALTTGAVAHTVAVNDTLTLADQVSRLSAYRRTPAEQLMLADLLARAVTANRPLTDAVSVSDLLAPELSAFTSFTFFDLPTPVGNGDRGSPASSQFDRHTPGKVLVP